MKLSDTAVTTPAHFTLLQALWGKPLLLQITFWSQSHAATRSGPGHFCTRSCLAHFSNKGCLTASKSRAPYGLLWYQSGLHISSFSGSNINVGLRFSLFLSISRHFHSLMPTDNLLRLFQGYCKYLLLHTCKTGGLSTQNRSQIVAGIGCIALLCFCSVHQCWSWLYPVFLFISQALETSFWVLLVSRSGKPFLVSSS